MSGGITVIGLTPGAFMIEDIRTSVPFQTAIQIPAHLAQRSRHLGEALQQQRIMQLGNTLPVAVSPKEPPLAPILRGRGIALHTPIATKQAEVGPWPREREALLRELELSRTQCLQLQGMNETLQVTLTSMADQLTRIQRTLDGLSPTQAAAPGRTVAVPVVVNTPPPTSFLDEAVPHFILPTTQGAAEVRISIPEGTSTSDLTDVRGALRTLRGKPSP